MKWSLNIWKTPHSKKTCLSKRNTHLNYTIISFFSCKLKIQKFGNKNYWQRYRKKALIHFWLEGKLVQPLGDQFGHIYQIPNAYILTCNPTSENLCLQYIYTFCDMTMFKHICCNIICNIQIYWKQTKCPSIGTTWVNYGTFIRLNATVIKMNDDDLKISIFRHRKIPIKF